MNNAAQWKHRVDWLVWAVLLLTGALVYSPGLTGTFLFDDWKNLELIGKLGLIDSLHELIAYLLSGFASVLGRPVAMASFLLDGRNWPADPALMKATNIALHLVNGTLVFILSTRLLKAGGMTATRAQRSALIGAGIWMLHPLFVSTTLYVVQRMAMLAATFVLLALIAYVRGRTAWNEGHGKRALWWLWVGVGLAALLGVLSKENAALLPLLILVVDHTVLSRTPMPESSSFRVWRWVMVRLPATALFVYLASYLPDLISGHGGRPQFTLGQRLLTEGRILWDYLLHLWLPVLPPHGLFNYDIVVSTSLGAPWSTLAAWIGLVALGWTAWALRRKAPLVSLAMGFFLFGHLLESTIIPLELQFEHRNYLPSALMFIPVGYAITSIPARRHAVVTSVAVIALLAVATFLRAELWGRPFHLALSWAGRSPESVRAQIHLAERWLETGNTEHAYTLARRTAQRHPEDVAAQVSLLGIGCLVGRADPSLLERIENLFSAPPSLDPVTQYQLERALDIVMDGPCPGIPSDTPLRWIASGLEGLPKEKALWRQMLLTRRATLALRAGRPEVALADFGQALEAHHSDEVVLELTAQLARAGALSQALRFLDEAPPPTPCSWTGQTSLRQIWLRCTGYYARERRFLRKTLMEDCARRHEECDNYFDKRHQRRKSSLTNSGPLSTRMVSGQQPCAFSCSRVRTTRGARSEVSISMYNASRLKSSIKLNVRKRLP